MRSARCRSARSLKTEAIEQKTRFKTGWLVWTELGQGITRPEILAKIRDTAVRRANVTKVKNVRAGIVIIADAGLKLAPGETVSVDKLTAQMQLCSRRWSPRAGRW